MARKRTTMVVYKAPVNDYVVAEHRSRLDHGAIDRRQ